MVDLRLFAKRNFRIGCTTLGLAYFAFMGVNIVFPCGCNDGGCTTTWAGLAGAHRC